MFDDKMAAVRLRLSPTNWNTLVINCAWSTPKINADALHTLRRIVDGVHRRFSVMSPAAEPPALHFRFYAALNANQSLEIAVLQSEILTSIQGSRFPHLVLATVVPSMSPTLYLTHAANAHLALDAYPFGGCNTVMVVELLPAARVHVCDVRSGAGHVVPWHPCPVSSRVQLAESCRLRAVVPIGPSGAGCFVLHRPSA